VFATAAPTIPNGGINSRSSPIDMTRKSNELRTVTFAYPAIACRLELVPVPTFTKLPDREDGEGHAAPREVVAHDLQDVVANRISAEAQGQ